MPDGRQERGHSTRRGIIAVARRLFSEFGYHRTGLADIQNATGLTKGAFYHHFRSKEELALAVLEAAREDYAKHWIAPAMQQETAAERIRALLDGALALNARPEWCNCQMLATIGAEMTSGDERIRDAARGLQTATLHMFRGLIKEAQDDGDVTPRLDPVVLAQALAAAITGTLLARKLGTLEVSPEDLFATLKGVVFGAAGT